jgi:hypothetical protein
MEVKTQIALEVEKAEGRIYRFILPAGAPLGEAQDAAFESLMQVAKWVQDNLEKLKEKKDEADKCVDMSCDDKEACAKK